MARPMFQLLCPLCRLPMFCGCLGLTVLGQQA